MTDSSGKVIQIDGQDFFAVEPRKDCPHINEDNVKRPVAYSLIKLDSPCRDCDNSGENWVCLKCAEVFCSRYVKEHMVAHNKDSSHPIALSFSDLSFWCYDCDDYIQSPRLRDILHHFQKLKFPEDTAAKDLEKEMEGLAIKEDDEGEDDDEEEESKSTPKISLPAGVKLSQAQDRKNLEEKEELHAKVKKTSLDYLDLDDICDKIKAGKFKRISFLTGAGISVSAGIPDFRSPGSGLYDQLEKYKLPYPEAVFSIDFFSSNPEPFFQLSKQLFQPEKFKPTPTHWFMRLLHDKGLLKLNMTQNIDSLEHNAGIPEDKVVECHGHFRTSHCSGCRDKISVGTMEKHIKAGDPLYCKKDSCGKPCKPDIVFFGEQLPLSFMMSAATELPKSDLLIIMGTSLKVQPFASLISSVKPYCPRILINRELAGHEVGGFQYGKEDNYRDVFLQGDCDAVVRTMAEKLGWTDELDALIKGSE